MSELTVQGCTFEASIDVTTGTINAPSLTTITQPSTDVLVNNKGVFFDKVTVVLPVGTTVTLLSPPPSAISPTGNLMIPANIDISGTASNILDSNGKVAVQKDDEGSDSVSFTFPTSNSTVISSVTVKVKVSDSGQTDVIAL